MGGTLPAMVRSLRLTADHIGSGGGLMYGANTAGAIIGALVSSFLLIPALGILGSALTAAGIGILAAAGRILARSFRTKPNQRHTTIKSYTACEIGHSRHSFLCRCRWVGAWV